MYLAGNTLLGIRSGFLAWDVCALQTAPQLGSLTVSGDYSLQLALWIRIHKKWKQVTAATISCCFWELVFLPVGDIDQVWTSAEIWRDWRSSLIPWFHP